MQFLFNRSKRFYFIGLILSFITLYSITLLTLNIGLVLLAILIFIFSMICSFQLVKKPRPSNFEDDLDIDSFKKSVETKLASCNSMTSKIAIALFKMNLALALAYQGKFDEANELLTNLNSTSDKELKEQIEYYYFMILSINNLLSYDIEQTKLSFEKQKKAFTYLPADIQKKDLNSTDSIYHLIGDVLTLEKTNNIENFLATIALCNRKISITNRYYCLINYFKNHNDLVNADRYQLLLNEFKGTIFYLKNNENNQKINEDNKK